MNEKMKVFEDLDVLVKMCRSKSDGASLKIEEEEIKNKIKEYELEIEEVKATAEEDNYDTSAEMADRNIEIITKKVIQSIKIDLKNKNSELDELKEKEAEASSNLDMLKSNKKSYEEYILSMQERIASTTDNAVTERYNVLISETEGKLDRITNELNSLTESYSKLQEIITNLTNEISTLEDKRDKKQEQLAETQHNLENKDTYIDQSKKEKTSKKIKEIESKKQKLVSRLEEIHNDPKYLEQQIKNVLTKDEDAFNAREYLIALIEKAESIPFMNVPANNALEEELLRATQARDSFANEIDQKSYSLMESVNPDQIRIEYLKKKISNWNNELNEIQEKAAIIDKDEQYGYQAKDEQLSELISAMKDELAEYKKAYDRESENNLSAKATLKVAIDEKREDIIEAEKIASLFRKEEAEEINNASYLIKVKTAEIENKIKTAEEEIENIKTRLLSKKTGIIDIGAQNKDKEKLKELANVVIDIKHRRQFADMPSAIAARLETRLDIDLTGNKLNNVQSVEKVEETPISIDELTNQEKRGVKVVTEAQIAEPESKPTDEETAIIDLASITKNTKNPEKNDNNYTNEPKSDNIMANGELAQELDAYINNLGAQVA